MEKVKVMVVVRKVVEEMVVKEEVVEIMMVKKKSKAELKVFL